MGIVNLKKYLLLPVLLAMVLLGEFVIASNQSKTKSNNVPAATSSPLPEENIADGIYTNNKYGFSFKYPEEIFDIQKPSTGPENYKKVSAPWYFIKRMESSNSTINIEVYVYKYVDDDKVKPGYGPTLFFEVTRKKDGEIINQYDSKTESLIPVGVKIRNIDIDDVDGVFYEYTEKFEDGKLGTEAYSADWLNDDKIYVIRLTAPNKNRLTSFREEFEKIINSFEFVATNN